MDSLQLFCNSGDPEHLKNIPENIVDKMIDESVNYLWSRTGKRNIQKILMHAYNLDDDGKEKSDVKDNRDEAEKLLSAFKVNLTGARSGDVLSGTSALNRGAIIRLHDGDVYPEQKKLDLIRKYPALWNRFLTRLGGVPYFSSMSRSEKERWLFLEEDSYHNRVVVGQGCLVEFLQPGNLTSKLTESDISTLMQGNPNHPKGWWTGAEIEAFFPRKPGSKARKHTLVMIRGFWRLSTDYEVVKTFSGLTIPLFSGRKKKVSDVIFVLKNLTKQWVKSKRKGSASWVRPSGKRGMQNVGVYLSDKGWKGTRTELGKIATFPNSSDFPKFYYDIERHLTNFTPAAYKSLIQKIIRYRAKNVTFPDNFLDIRKNTTTTFSTDQVLVCSILQLIKMPGSFVPDIQRYVSGMESAFKRVGVAVVEDGYSSSDSVCTVLCGALLAQRIKSWRPPVELVRDTLTSALKTLNSNKYWDWANAIVPGTKPVVLDKTQNSAQRSSALLDELRSFSGDLAMMRSINNAKVIKGNESRPDTMPVTHCVDHHWAPDMIYMFDPEIVYNLAVQGSSPFSKLLGALWDNVSSLNPRKQVIQLSDFALKAQSAQQNYMIARQAVQYSRSELKKTYVMPYSLHPGWISAMVGSIEVGGSPPAIVTLAANNPKTLIAIRRPSRDVTDTTLTEDQEQIAVSKAMSRLRRGVPLKAASAPIPLLENSVLYLDDNDFIIKLRNGKRVAWHEILTGELNYPIHPKSVRTFPHQLVEIGDGVENDAEKSLSQLLLNTDPKVIRRLLTFLNTFGNRIEMNRISRDGGGTVHAVLPMDVEVYQKILQISQYFPGALRPRHGQPGQFDVPSSPLLWHVTDKIKKAMVNLSNVKSNWKPISDKKKRKLRDHQVGAIDEMVENHRRGNMGTFLWMKVGSGKTLIVLSYIKWLISQNRLPPYVVYTLPESAMNSVVDEISQFNLPMTLLVPLKNIKGRKFPKGVEVINGCDPKPNCINLIASDGNMRKCEEGLSRIAENALVIFDEVHKNMNDTKRTSVALGLARLAKEFIAFTGTPVVDSKTYKLIAWLKMIVAFEVNNSNYLVAANDMITYPVKTGIIVKREEVFATMTKDEEKMYNNLVPPALGGTNSNPRPEDWQMASSISYEACNTEMVDQTFGWLDKGRRVMLVAKDSKHQQKLYEIILDRGLPASDVFVLTGATGSIHLTDESVKNGGPDYKVVIVPISKSEGYTLTRCNVMISSVYPSNQASRTQIEGRINRLTQNAKAVYYIIVHTGILTNILQNHNKARSLEKALAEISQKV